MVFTPSYKRTRNRNADTPMTPPRDKQNRDRTLPRYMLKRASPYGGFVEGGSPDRKRNTGYGPLSPSGKNVKGRGFKSPPKKKFLININDPLGSINQEDSVGLPVDYDPPNDSFSRIGNNTNAMLTSKKGVTFDPFATETINTPLKITQNKTLRSSYPYAHSDNTRFTSPPRTYRSSHNEFDPVQKLNSILRRLEEVLESLLT